MKIVDKLPVAGVWGSKGCKHIGNRSVGTKWSPGPCLPEQASKELSFFTCKFVHSSFVVLCAARCSSLCSLLITFCKYVDRGSGELCKSLC